MAAGGNPLARIVSVVLVMAFVGGTAVGQGSAAAGKLEEGLKYLRAGDRESVQKAIALLREALAADLSSEEALAALAQAEYAGWQALLNLMASGEVVIQSMWSPAITAVRSKGIPCVYQPLKEGYRSWGGGIGLSKNLKGLELEAAYEYINWYLSSWVGGFLMRQGYYSAVPETSKNFMSADEWGFWFEGKPAQGDIKNPQGQVMEKAGAVRDGGSFYDRMGRVACWNAVMDENQYMVRKWNEFIAA